MKQILIAVLSLFFFHAASAAIIEKQYSVNSLSTESGVEATAIVDMTGVLQHESLYVSQADFSTAAWDSTEQAAMTLIGRNDRRGDHRRPGHHRPHRRHRHPGHHRPYPRHRRGDHWGCPWGTVSVKLGKLGRVCVRIGR